MTEDAVNVFNSILHEVGKYFPRNIVSQHMSQPNKLETGFLFVFCLTTVQESSSWTFAYHGFIITPNLTDECSSSFGETCLLLKSKFQKFVPTIWDRVCTVFG